MLNSITKRNKRTSLAILYNTQYYNGMYVYTFYIISSIKDDDDPFAKTNPIFLSRSTTTTIKNIMLMLVIYFSTPLTFMYSIVRYVCLSCLIFTYHALSTNENMTVSLLTPTKYYSAIISYHYNVNKYLCPPQMPTYFMRFILYVYVI